MNHSTNNILLYCIASFLFLPITCFPLYAQKSQKGKKVSVEKYIDNYKNIAISEMKRTEIPASITLAQGILESKFGNSFLVKKGKNHFGIKCHRSWKGQRIYANDDRRKECFRRYKSHYASYIDHSNFLLHNKRYGKLFKIKKTDYRGWAYGLKEAGYATNPKYAKELVILIKRYELFKFDKADNLPLGNCTKEIVAKPSTYNGIKTVMFDCAITPDRIEAAYKLSLDKLLKYNNLSYTDTVQANTVIYLQQPKSRGPKGIKKHKVTKDETMETIARLYGIKTKSLYRRNRMTKGMVPKTGETVVLRGKNKQQPAVENVVSKEKNQKALKVKYIVKKGDTLYSLARRYNTTVKKIQTINKLPNSHLKIGQELIIYAQ